MLKQQHVYNDWIKVYIIVLTSCDVAPKTNSHQYLCYFLACWFPPAAGDVRWTRVVPSGAPPPAAWGHIAASPSRTCVKTQQRVTRGLWLAAYLFWLLPYNTGVTVCWIVLNDVIIWVQGTFEWKKQNNFTFFYKDMPAPHFNKCKDILLNLSKMISRSVKIVKQWHHNNATVTPLTSVRHYACRPTPVPRAPELPVSAPARTPWPCTHPAFPGWSWTGLAHLTCKHWRSTCIETDVLLTHFNKTLKVWPS